MSERLQTVVDDKLGERVRRAAAKDRRSVSEWIALRLEEVLGSDGPSEAEVARAVEALGGKPGTVPHPIPEDQRPTWSCTHQQVEKRTTPTLGTRRYCADCGVLLP